MNTRSHRITRLRLFNLDPHCYWCGRLLVWWTHVEHKGLPRNVATLDHLHFRGDPLRQEHRGCDCPRHVLACYRCNTTRYNPYARERSESARRQIAEQMQEYVK